MTAGQRKEQGQVSSLEDGGERTKTGSVGVSGCPEPMKQVSWVGGKTGLCIRHRMTGWALGRSAMVEVWLSLYLAKDRSKVRRGSVRRGWPD